MRPPKGDRRGRGFPESSRPTIFGRRQDALRRCRPDAAGLGIEIEHRIDDGGAPGFGIGDEIADRIGRGVEEGGDDGFHGKLLAAGLDEYIRIF